jgi:hypothetical protein
MQKVYMYTYMQDWRDSMIGGCASASRLETFRISMHVVGCGNGFSSLLRCCMPTVLMYLSFPSLFYVVRKSE